MQKAPRWPVAMFLSPAVMTFVAAVVTGANAYSDGPKGLTLAAAAVGAGGALRAAIEGRHSEHELRVKSEEIAKLSRDIASTVTGGDSCCYITLSISPRGNQGVITVVHQGDYPLHDVSADIADLDQMGHLEGGAPTWNELMRSRTALPIGNWPQPKQRSSATGRFQTPASDGTYSSLPEMASKPKSSA